MLRGTQIFLDNDVSEETREKRKKLFKYAKAEKKRDKDITLEYDRILINGKSYDLIKEGENEKLIEIISKNKSSSAHEEGKMGFQARKKK